MIKRGILIALFLLVLSSSIVLADVNSIEERIYNGDVIDLVQIMNKNNLTVEEGTEFTLSSEHYGNLIDKQYVSKRSGSVLVFANHPNGDETIISLVISSPLKEFKFARSKLTLYLGTPQMSSFDLIYADGYKTENVVDVTFRSTDEKVFSVDQNGMLYPNGLGEARLIAKDPFGNELGKMTITVDSKIKDIYIESRKIKTDVYSGQSKQLEVTFLSSLESPNPEIVWSSEDPETVSVDSNGTVTGHKTGSALIWAKVKGTPLDDSIRVTVNGLVSDLVLSNRTVTLDNSTPTYQLTANLLPKYVEKPVLNSKISWLSTNTNIVEVSENGLLTAVGTGRAKVIAESQDGNRYDECEVYVQFLDTSANVALESIKISGIPKVTYIGKSYEIDFEYSPEWATFEKMLTTSSNGGSRQIKYVDGKYYFIPYKAGKTVIEFKVPEGPSSKMVVDVISYLRKVEIDKASLQVLKEGIPSLYVGQEMTLNAILTNVYKYRDEELVYKGVTWSTDDSKIVEIDSRSGEIKALKEGKATIKVVTDDNAEMDELEVQVIPMVYDIDLPPAYDLELGQVYKPEVSFDVPYGFEEPIEKGFTLRVDDMFLTQEFVNDEISYEESVLNSLNTLNIDSPALNVEMMKHKVRLKKLKDILKTSQGEYCRYHGDLKDRSGDTLKVYEIKGMWIKGLLPSRLELEVTSVDGNKSEKMNLYIVK